MKVELCGVEWLRRRAGARGRRIRDGGSPGPALKVQTQAQAQARLQMHAAKVERASAHPLLRGEHLALIAADERPAPHSLCRAAAAAAAARRQRQHHPPAPSRRPGQQHSRIAAELRVLGQPGPSGADASRTLQTAVHTAAAAALLALYRQQQRFSAPRPATHARRARPSPCCAT